MIKQLTSKLSKANNIYDLWFCILMLTASFIIYILPDYVEKQDDDKQTKVYSIGKVLAVENDIMHLGVYIQGEQKLEIEILKGVNKGENISVYNCLNANPQVDTMYKVNDKMLVQLVDLDDGSVIGQPAGLYRLNAEVCLILVFALLLVMVAGWTGVKALLSFVFAGLMLVKILFPLFLNGYNPIFSALIVAALITAAINFLVGGINKRGLVAFFGGFLGLLTTCILAIVFAQWIEPNGMSRPFAKNLLQCVSADLDFRQIFLAGVMIASSGAVMDLSMDISSAMKEVYASNRGISSIQLFKSGMNVGRSVVGTMTTTLLLAYSGGYTTMIMYFMSQGIDSRVVLNSNIIAGEVLNVIVGSFGLVTVAPFTAIVGALVYTKARAKS